MAFCRDGKGRYAASRYKQTAASLKQEAKPTHKSNPAPTPAPSLPLTATRAYGSPSGAIIVTTPQEVAVIRGMPIVGKDRQLPVTAEFKRIAVNLRKTLALPRNYLSVAFSLSNFCSINRFKCAAIAG
jgi:hypothetical protein